MIMCRTRGEHENQYLLIPLLELVPLTEGVTEQHPSVLLFLSRRAQKWAVNTNLKLVLLCTHVSGVSGDYPGVPLLIAGLT